jgi:hypothetical protein
MSTGAKVITIAPSSWQAYIGNKNPTKEEKQAYMLAYEHQHADYYKAYRLAHRDKWQEKIVCECGAFVNRINKGTHLKSKKHERFSHAMVCT